MGGTVITLFAILFLVPLMARKWAPLDRNPDDGANGGDDDDHPNGDAPSPLEMARLLVA